MYICLNPSTIGVQVDLKSALALAQRHAFAGLDFSIGEVADLVADEGYEGVQEHFAAAGVRPGAWAFPVNFRTDEATWKADLAQLPRLAAMARELGFLRTYTYIIPGDNERTYAANFRFHVERLKPAAQVLAEHGIAFGLEWVGTHEFRHRYRHDFIHTMDGMRALNAAIGTPNMGLLVDIFHVENAKASAADLRRLAPAEVVYVHVNDAAAGVAVDDRIDNVRDLPGYTNELAIVDFLHSLRDIGYDGPVTAEPFSQRLRDLPAADAVAETGAAMHAMWRAAGLA